MDKDRYEQELREMQENVEKMNQEWNGAWKARDEMKVLMEKMREDMSVLKASLKRT